MKKYIVIGGYIVSKKDNDRHYVGPMELIKLYGVDPKECILVNQEYDPRTYKDLIELRPRYDGDYIL
jgi:hypothetical protein